MDLFEKKPEILWRVKGVDLEIDLELAKFGQQGIELQKDTIYAWSYGSPNLTAIDKDSGKIKRKFSVGSGNQGRNVTEGMYFYSKPIEDAKTFQLYAARTFQLHAFDLKKEQEIWFKNVSYLTSNISNKKVYASVGFNKIIALDSANGNQVWTFEIEFNQGPFQQTELPIISADQKIVLVGFDIDNGVIYALDADSGSQMWKFENGKSLPDAILVRDGIAYVAYGHQEREEVYAFDAATGKNIWQSSFETNPGAGGGGRAIHLEAYNGVLYSAQTLNHLRAIDKNGRQLWEVPIENFVTSLVVSENTVYLAEHHSPDAFSNEKLYLYAIESKTGKVNWRYTKKGEIEDIEVNEGIVYLAIDEDINNEIIALRRK